jgi:hypothetical protein
MIYHIYLISFFSLSGKEIGAKGVKALCEALKTNTTVTKIK